MVEGNDAPNKLSRSEPLLAVSAPRLRLGRLETDVSSEDTRFGFGDAVNDEEPSLETLKDSALSFPGVGDSVERPNRRRRGFEEGPVSPCELPSFDAEGERNLELTSLRAPRSSSSVGACDPSARPWPCLSRAVSLGDVTSCPERGGRPRPSPVVPIRVALSIAAPRPLPSTDGPLNDPLSETPVLERFDTRLGTTGLAVDSGLGLSGCVLELKRTEVGTATAAAAAWAAAILVANDGLLRDCEIDPLRECVYKYVWATDGANDCIWECAGV